MNDIPSSCIEAFGQSTFYELTTLLWNFTIVGTICEYLCEFSEYIMIFLFLFLFLFYFFFCL